ncbi:MAG TPA: LysR family transcriptional regulator [Paucimonas sp.]|nr:LysR family transcriptional regulator [Paucimonas sp.]
MRLTLRQLQIFLAVAQSGSTTAAAVDISLSQSAASAALNELESVLGTRLFDRVGKRLLLNDNGRLLLPQARQTIDAARSIERQFAQAAPASAAGLRIGASTTIGSYLLPALLAAYRARFGDAPMRATIANTADIVAAVANYDVDIGFIEGPCHEPELQVEPWLADELIIACAPAHPLAARDGGRITAKALREAEWLLREPGSGTREAVEHALISHLHHLRPAGEFSNSEAIKYAAAEGLGIACLSRWVVRDLIESGKLVELKTTLPPLRRRFYTIRGRRKMLSPNLERLLRFCQEWPQAV